MQLDGAPTAYGPFVESTGEDSIDVSYPYDGTVWARVPDGTVEDVNRAVGGTEDLRDRMVGLACQPATGGALRNR